MKTLYEEVRASARPAVQEDMDGAMIVQANNVAIYYNETRKDWNAIDSFPNVAPPFAKTWIEFQNPPEVVEGMASRLPIYAPFLRGQRFGALLQRWEHRREAIPYRVERLIPDLPEGARWVVLSQETSRSPDVVSTMPDGTPWMMQFLYAVNGDGSLAAAPDGGPYVRRVPEDWDRPQAIPEFSRLETERMVLYVALLTMSFMHCKNVTLDPVDPPTGKVRNRRDRPRIRYHVLKIRPMVRGGGASGPTGSTGPVSLHIRRGHFRTYTDAAPMFGKLVGTFWIDNTVVGRNAGTQVDKSYRVEPPPDDDEQAPSE